jgi:hypothetical protein
MCLRLNVKYVTDVDGAAQRWHSPATGPARPPSTRGIFAGVPSPKNRALGSPVQCLVGPPLLPLIG